MPELTLDSREWREIVINGAKNFGVSIDSTAAGKLAAHCVELIRWNEKINLTAVVDPVEIAVKHVIDSLAALPLLPEGAAVLDLGSGGGFPGLVLKIANPGLSVYLLEATRKKVSFLKQVIRILALKDIEVIHARTEELAARKEFAGKFDAVTCRAFTSLSSFIAIAEPLVKNKGILIAYKSRRVQEEIKRLASDEAAMAKDQASRIFGTPEVRPYILPHLDIEQYLVVVKKANEFLIKM
jgi:16S rRNA (guanine527-N7)-methyltransferase